MPTLAQAPTRVVANTNLTLGLLSIEVGIYTTVISGNASARSMFCERDGEFHEVGKQNYDKVTGDPVPNEDIVKGVMDNGQVIVITDDEIAALGNLRGTTPIIGFISRDEILNNPAIIPNGAYQIRPAMLRIGSKRRPNPVAERAFAGILDKMHRSNLVAVVEFVMRDNGSKKFGIIDYTGTLYTVAYTDIVREPLPLPDESLSMAEQNMMDTLVDAMILDDIPDMPDTMGAHVQAIVAAKRDGSVPVIVAPAPAPKVDGLMAMLEAAIAERAATR